MSSYPPPPDAPDVLPGEDGGDYAARKAESAAIADAARLPEWVLLAEVERRRQGQAAPDDAALAERLERAWRGTAERPGTWADAAAEARAAERERLFAMVAQVEALPACRASGWEIVGAVESMLVLRILKDPLASVVRPGDARDRVHQLRTASVALSAAGCADDAERIGRAAAEMAERLRTVPR